MKKRTVRYDPKNDYYERIGITQSASIDEVQQAYRRRAKQLHPDLNPDKREWATEQFQLLNEAYAVLSDKALRITYDQQRWPYVPNVGSKKQGPQRQHKAARRSSPSDGVEWWNVPQQSNGQTFTYTGRRPPDNRARWMEKWGLGAIRPNALWVFDLLRSPYGVLIFILTAVLAMTLFVNVAVLISQ